MSADPDYGFRKWKSKVTAEAKVTFLELPWDSPLIKVPGVGPATVEKFKAKGIMTLYQLAGVFLTFKTLNEAGNEPISEHDWCQKMWEYLNSIGTPATFRSGLIDALGEKLALSFEGIYEPMEPTA